MGIDKAIEVILRLKDQTFRTGIKDAESQLRSFSENMSNIGQKSALAFAGLGAIVYGAANSFREFEAGMSNISTIVDTSKESMSAMGQEVLDMSKRMPVGINDLVAGLYDLRSAGIDGAQAMGALEASAKLGVAGLGTTAESVDLMTTAMNAFSSEGLSANTIADILFKTTQYGKNTISQLSEAFGTTAPLVKSAGVSLADFSAATAALTAVGVPAAEAQNSIRAAVVALKKPTEEMEAVFKSLHVNSGPELIKVSGNIGNAFKAVQEEAARLGIPLEKVTGRVEGAAAMTSLATSANATYVKSLNDMTSGINTLDGAFAKQAATFDSTIKLMVNNVQVLAIQIGAAMAPALTLVANAIKTVSDLFSRLPDPIKQVIASGLLVATVLTGIVAGATLLIGSIAGAIASITSLTATVGAAVAGWVAANGTLIALAAFIGSMMIPVIVGAGAAVAAFAAAWNTNFLGIQTFTKQTVAFVGSVLGDMFNGIGKWLQDAYSWTADLLNKIGKAITPWISGVGNAVGGLFNGLGQLIGGFGSGVLKFLGGVFTGVLNGIIDLARGAAGVINPMLAKLNLPTINVDVMVSSVKMGTDIALNYFKTKWAEAGKIAVKIPKVGGAATPAFVGNKPGASQGGNPYVAPDGEKDKKAASEAAKKQTEAVRQVVETLTNSLKSNKLALDETIVKMGAYATEGEKLSAQLIKLDKDEATLAATRNKLSGMKVSGEAEKARLKALQDINEQIRQNGIDEIQVKNEIAKYNTEKQMTDALKANEQALETRISKMGVYANETTKLSAVLDKLKADELALQKIRAQIATQPGSAESQLEALKEIDDKIKKIGAEQIKTQKEITKATDETGRARIEAEEKIEQTKERIRNEYQKRQEDHEMRGLDDLLNRKIISQRAYNDAVSTIRNAQDDREVEMLNQQIQLLMVKQAKELETNGATEKSLEIYQQILDLTSQIEGVKEQGRIREQEAKNGLAANDPVSMVSFLNSVQQGIEQFNQNFVQGIINGNLRIGESFKNLGISILTDFQNKVFKGLSDGFFTFIKSAVTGNVALSDGTTKAATGMAASVHSVFLKLGSGIASIFQNLTGFVIGAFKAIFNAQKLAAVKGAIITAHSSAMKAYDAVVGIPVVGPFLAPAAYATALGFQLAKAAIIGGVSAGFAVGTPELPSDMVAQVHKGEMIIPASFAQAIRSGDLSLSGGKSAQQQAQPAQVIQISFEGANFNGVPREWVDELEKLLIEKQKIRGSALFGV